MTLSRSVVLSHSMVLALSLTLATAAFAVDYSITPSSGPATGGTEVTIKGEFGFWPYDVLFDGIGAVSTVKVDSSTLVAVTPPHLPGPANVVVFEYDIGLETGLTFNFTGNVPAQYESVLVPLLTEPVHGAFGSEFYTTFSARNPTDLGIPIYGLEELCVLSVCPPVPNDSIPLILSPHSNLPDIALTGTPGRFLYVSPDNASQLAFNLRVHDVTRAALNFGTEIPVVRSREMGTGAITLIGIPTDPRFRNTLRIYATDQSFLLVTFSDGEESIQRSVSLPAGRNIFEPAYAEIGDFPVFASGKSEIMVTIVPPATLSILPPPPFWGFVSVTNNETQVITTITPQR